MKIIILDNFLNSNYHNTSRFFIRWIQLYKEIKLKSLIKKLRKNYGKNTEIKIFSTRSKQYRLDSNIQTVLASDFRIDIDREEFIKIKKKVIDNVKNIMINIFNNLRTSKNFYIEGIFLGKLIEYGFAKFLKNKLGEFEILKKILATENFDKGILFDFNPKLLPFFKELNKKFRNLELFKDFILKQVKNSSFWFFSKYLLDLIGFTTKKYFRKKKRLKNSLIKKLRNILFICNTPNQYESIRKIYEWYSNDKNYGAILYHNEYTILLNEITNLFRFSFQIRNAWLKGPNNVIGKLRYNSIKLKSLLKEYYKFELYFSSIKAFNNLNNFKKILDVYSPVTVILADELQAEARLCAKYCKIKRIPTIYIPHGGIPVWPELTEEYDFTYITVAGELEKEYLTGKGIQAENIIITGKSRYDKLYNGEIKEAIEVKDLYNNRVYKFDPNKFKILYITNRVDTESSRAYDKGVLLSLNNLNLMENLVIKIHPYGGGIRNKWIREELKIEAPIIIRDYDLLELIKSSDLVLSQGTVSITVLESMISGTPVVVLDFVNLDFYFSGYYKFYEEKDLIVINNHKFLHQTLKKLIYDEKFYDEYSNKLKELAKKYSFYDDKNTATENLIKFINKILY